MTNRSLRLASLLLGCLAVAACAATTTAISKRELDVQTRMSDSIFLEPLPPARRNVFIQVKNTSDREDFDIEADVKAAILDRGYQLVDNPERAHYMLQANVLQAGKSSVTAAEDAFSSGFGGALFGAAVGAVGTRAVTKDTGSIIGGGLIGAAVESAAGAFVQDVTYSAITDIQVSERATDGEVVTEAFEQDLGQGTSGTRIVRANSTSSWKRYRTRVMSVANKVNLDFE
ncbi:MAG: complement resistance protein TraT, partial [Alphaproteobacteria bacterium]|nr:complement resistance protein TraT [Alphaproteobacteria bacterium]